jgi:hypothetical protein
MHVRKAEIGYWIEQGWLEAVRKDQGRSTCYNISPEALQRCLREHLQDLQKRNIRSSTILAVFNQFCYVPKHTVGEQLLQVREAKREEAAYESLVFSDRRKGRRLCINCFQVGVRERVALSGRALERFRSNVASGGDLLMNECIELFLYRASCSWSTKSMRSPWPRTFRPSPQHS